MAKSNKGFMDKPKDFPKYGTLTVFTEDYEALTPLAFKVLRDIRLHKDGGDCALHIAGRLDTSVNSVRRRITELRNLGFCVYTEAHPIFKPELVYYVRD